MSFDQFYQEHVGFVRACLRRFGTPFEDVDEACQTIFLSLLRLQSSIRAVRPWLFVASRLEAQRRRCHRVADARRRESLRHLDALLPAPRPPDSREALRDFLVELADGCHPAALIMRKLIWQRERVLADVVAALGVSEDEILVRSPRAARAFAVLCWLFQAVSDADDECIGVILGQHPYTVRRACRLLQTEINAGTGPYLFALQLVFAHARVSGPLITKNVEDPAIAS